VKDFLKKHLVEAFFALLITASFIFSAFYIKTVKTLNDKDIILGELAEIRSAISQDLDTTPSDVKSLVEKEFSSLKGDLTIKPSDVQYTIKDEFSRLNQKLTVLPSDVYQKIDNEFANLNLKLDVLLSSGYDIVYILEHAGFGIAKANKYHKIIGWNDNAVDIFGYSQNEALDSLYVEDLMHQNARSDHKIRYDDGFNAKSHEKEGFTHSLMCNVAQHKNGNLFEITLLVIVPKDSDVDLAVFWPDSIIKQGKYNK